MTAVKITAHTTAAVSGAVTDLRLRALIQAPFSWTAVRLVVTVVLVALRIAVPRRAQRAEETLDQPKGS
jgi:hypothetical protein